MFSVENLLHYYMPTRAKPGWLVAMLRRLFYERDFQQFSARYPHLQGLDFVEQVLSYFDFACDVADNELEHIPASGPVVLVANHPIGTLDGMALLRVIARVRPDVRIVANQLLNQVAPMQPEAIAHREQRFADQHLGQGVLALDTGHHLAALGGADDIGHGGSRYVRQPWPADQAALTSGMPSAGSE